MLTPTHFWIAFFGTGGLLVLLAYLGGRRRRLNPREVEQAGGPVGCGQCGYDVRGLPSSICPECGSDLDDVGRLTSRFRKWQAVPIAARLIAWTITLCAVGGGLQLYAIVCALPRERIVRAEGNWWILAPLPEGSGEAVPFYRALDVRFDARFVQAGPSADQRFDEVTNLAHDRQTRFEGAAVTIRAQDRPIRSVRSGGWAFLDSGGTTARVMPGEGTSKAVELPLPAHPAGVPTFSPGDVTTALIQGFRQVGYNGTHGSAEDLALALAPEINAFLQDGAVIRRSRASPWKGSSGFVRATGPRQLTLAPLVAAIAFWVVVCVLGLPFVLRKRPLKMYMQGRTHPKEPAVSFGTAVDVA